MKRVQWNSLAWRGTLCGENTNWAAGSSIDQSYKCIIYSPVIALKKGADENSDMQLQNIKMAPSPSG